MIVWHDRTTQSVQQRRLPVQRLDLGRRLVIFSLATLVLGKHLGTDLLDLTGDSLVVVAGSLSSTLDVGLDGGTNLRHLLGKRLINPFSCGPG